MGVKKGQCCKKLRSANYPFKDLMLVENGCDCECRRAVWYAIFYSMFINVLFNAFLAGYMADIIPVSITKTSISVIIFIWSTG